MRLLATLLITLAFSLPSYALELTDQNVQKWIKSYSAVMDWSKTQDKKELEFLEKEQQSKDPELDALFSNALKGMEKHKLYAEFSGVLKQNGYSDPQEWAQLGDRIMAATMAVEMEKHQANSAQSQAQMQKAMQAMKNNPNISPEQMAQMQKMMGIGNQMMEVADNVPAKDKEVIRRNATLIQQVMDKNAKQN